MRRTLVPVIPVLLGLLAVGGCGTDEPAAPPPAAPAAAPTAPEPTAAPTFPADVRSPEQGGHYVAVVLATGSTDELKASRTSVAAYGYTAGVSDVACLDGLAQGLDLADDALVSSLLFADERAASRFADAYVAAEDGLMVGRAPVTAYCLD